MQDTERSTGRHDRFGLARASGQALVLTAVPGLVVEHFFDKGEGFSPLLFILGALSLWVTYWLIGLIGPDPGWHQPGDWRNP